MTAPARCTLFGENLWISPYVFSTFVALREKGIAFAVMEVELAAGKHLQPNYRDVSLTARVPSFDHDGFRLAESNAIAMELLALILGAASCARFVKPSRPYVPVPIGVRTWHGYPRYDFVLGGHRCTMVTPRQVAKGVPWVWRASFFDERPEVEVALLAAGFHVVYADVIDLCGSAAAVAQWDAVNAGPRLTPIASPASSPISPCATSRAGRAGTAAAPATRTSGASACRPTASTNRQRCASAATP